MARQSDRPQRLALITGGCRRIGAVIAGHLAQQGWSLALHGHNDTQPDEQLAGILSTHQTEWAGFRADLLDSDAVESLIGEVASHFGRKPDLLINNASLFEHDQLESMTAEIMERQWRIHVLAPTLLTRSLFRHLSEKQRSSVINIVDQRIRNPHVDQLSYTLSKQAMAESVRTLAVACAPRLRVNGIAPGMTLKTDEYTDQHIANIAGMMPLQINSTPDDIASAVAFCADATAMTGQLLYIDGGAHLKSYERDFVHLAEQ